MEVRSRCQLIWDSRKGPVQSRSSSRTRGTGQGIFIEGIKNNIVTARISFFEEKKVKENKKKGVQIEAASLKLQFNDTATSMYEYEAEELALERYLVDHPDEKAEVEKEKLEILAMESSSSTDEPDVDTHQSKEVVTAVTLKTNTVLTAGGSLSNYKSKMQVDFKFGITQQEEPEPEVDEEETEELNSQQLRPAQESELEAFSAEAHGRASDMLF